MAEFMYESFSGGLTQTDWFGIATGTISTAAAGLSYNQAAYTSNVGMRQSQLYQKKNYNLGWASVARQDIRSLMGITVTRIQNYTLVATLIVGMTWAGLLGFTFQPNCPGFIFNAFWVSMGLSILFFSQAIMFAVKGQNSAFVNTMRLLTWELRPENPSTYDHDYMSQTQQLEKEGLRSVFRIPGMSPRTEEKKPASDGIARSQTQADLDRNLPEERAGRTGDRSGASGPLEDLRPRTRQLVHLARFAHFMQLWQPFDSQAKFCIGVGLLSLMQGGIYYFLGQGLIGGFFTSPDTLKEACISALVMCIFVYIIIMVYEANAKFNFAFTKWCVMLLFCSAPTAAWAAAAVPSVTLARKVLEIVCGVLHCALFVAIYVRSFREAKAPAEETQKIITGPSGQKFTAYSGTDVESGAGAFVAELDLAAPCQREAEEAQSVAIRDSVQTSTRRSLLLASIVWFCVLLADVVEVAYLGASELTVQEVHLNWPTHSTTVWPHALVSIGQEAFVANRFQVFRISLDGDGNSGNVAPFPCPGLSGTIADVTATCDDEGLCHPIVLTKGGSKAVDCATGEAIPLQQQDDGESEFGAPKHFAVRTSLAKLRALSEPMFTVQGDAVVTYKWQRRNSTAEEGAADENGGEWNPLWKTLEVDGNSTRSLDCDGSRIYIAGQMNGDGWSALHGDSFVRAFDLSSLEELGSWVMPRRRGWPLAAASAAGPGLLHLLPEGPTPNLLRWNVPV